jgi:hypothetical protein
MVVVQVAISLTALLAVTAIALDVGTLLTEQRHGQAAADAAALAGAIDLFTNYQTNNGTDPKGTAKASALSTAAANGYSNDGVTSTVTVNIPPKSGYFVGVAGYVEVIVQYNQSRGFSNLFGSGRIPVKARAVARGAWKVPKGGILVLDPTAPGALSTGGGGNVNVNGGIVIVDSNNTGTNGAMTVSGGGTVTAQGFNLTGDYKGTVGSPGISTAPNTLVPPTPDPLAYLPAPGAPGGPPIPGAGTITKSGNTYTLTPGSFSNLPNFTSSDTVIFKQASYNSGSADSGIYYLTAGGLTSNGATLMMDPNTTGGIMLYNAGTGSNDGISIAGGSSGSVNLAGLTSGRYQGLLIFQARGATENVSITGNGSFSMEGTIYAPSGNLKLTGNGSSSVIGSNLIADTVTISGSGNMVVDYNGYVQPKARYLGLVE